MEYLTLGRTGLRVSRLGFGGIPIQRADAGKARELVLAMKDAGVNYIDSARGYTVSEAYIGEALEGVRDSFILATKSMARTREAMAADIETSLRNFRTGYIDLYQVHNPNDAALDQVIGEGGALEALLEAKEAGKIGHIGLTAHSKAVAMRALDLPWVETVMFPFNIVEDQGRDVIEKAKEKNAGFIAMKPLAGGAIESGRTALRFLAKERGVDLIIPGMAELGELRENIAAVSDPAPYSPEEEAEADAIRSSLGSGFCRRCNYCAPCTAGISIPNVFLFEGYLERYGLEEWARSRYATLAKKASDCVGCGVCESRCPYELPIRAMMQRARKAFGE